MTIIRGLPVRLPPLRMQEKYARRVAAIEVAKVAHSRSMAACDRLFASLQLRAFRGEL
jgi:type I restriction enzyme S subunit